MSVERSTATLETVTEDFGHLLRGSPTGVLRPRWAQDVVDAVTQVVAWGSKLTLRGFGHSAGSQALPADSVGRRLLRDARRWAR